MRKAGSAPHICEGECKCMRTHMCSAAIFALVIAITRALDQVRALALTTEPRAGAARTHPCSAAVAAAATASVQQRRLRRPPTCHCVSIR